MVDTSVYSKLNEGLGGAYERVAYSNVIKRLAESRRCRSILELNATYIAGIPGFNSCLLVQAGYDVTVTVNERDLVDTLKAWEMLGLSDMVKILPLGIKFQDQEFDFVWNHLAFEHYKDPTSLISEMSRISNDVVMNLTLSPFNLGFPLHWLMHVIRREEWDHGYFRNTTIGSMQRAHRKAGLVELENGACDVPPWMDTVDGKMGGSMTYLDSYPKAVRDKWIWCSADPRCQTHSVVRFLWSIENTLPVWFKKLVGHHLYVVSTVRSN